MGGQFGTRAGALEAPQRGLSERARTLVQLRPDSFCEQRVCWEAFSGPVQLVLDMLCCVRGLGQLEPSPREPFTLTPHPVPFAGRYHTMYQKKHHNMNLRTGVRKPVRSSLSPVRSALTLTSPHLTPSCTT